jgi:transposase
MEKGQKRRRRRFSDEYKAETVRLIQRRGKSIGKMALELGIGETALRRQVEQAEVEAGRWLVGALKQSETSLWKSDAKISDCDGSARS